MRAACIGVGNVGRSWAIVFARASWDVSLWDAYPGVVDRALGLIRVALDDAGAAGLPVDADAVLARIHVAHGVEDAVAGADYIQESAAEEVTVKQSLFGSIDSCAPSDAIIASSTSAIQGASFMGDIPGRHRCVVAHPVNPPHIIPLVEICASPWTDKNTVDRTYEIMKEVGQSPVILNREIDGFLLNRLQWALMGEALHLVGEGVCSPEDIDRVLTQGLALRWAFIGPFEVAHLNATQGVEGYYDVLREAVSRVQGSLRTDYPPDARTVKLIHEAMSRRTPVETIPDRQAWRDRRLMALRRHLADAGDKDP
jgi:3-hydroxyacyl-CoA dehydrogenase